MRFNFLSNRSLQRWVLSIAMTTIFVCMIGYGCWIYFSPIPVITSKAGHISRGTFSYLRFVYYSNPQQKDITPKEIYEDLKQYMAMGVLADRLGLSDDPYYPHFLNLTYQARIQRASVELLKQRIGPDFMIQEALRQYAIVSDPQTATDRIQKCIQRDRHRFRMTCPEVVIGTMKDQPLRLSMIKPLMTEKEWHQFLSFLPIPMVDAYKKYLTRFLYHTVHQTILEHYSPVKKELSQMDHNLVAKRYLSVKYGMSHDGIYPTQRLTLDFPQTILFNHFFSIKKRFLPVKTVNVQYTVVENMDIAKMLYQKLIDGADIIQLARQYAINDFFIKTAYLHNLSGYGIDGMPSHPDQRAIIDNFLLDAARNEQYYPSPHPLDKGVLIAHLSHLIRQDHPLNYNEYQFAVKRDLTLKTLKTKFSVDIEDIMSELSFQFQINQK